MAKKQTAKATTLRQRLRADAEDKLQMLLELVAEHSKASIQHHTDINVFDLMRLLTQGQTKTLRQQVITDLANEAERKLEKLYNDQMALPGVEEDE